MMLDFTFKVKLLFKKLILHIMCKVVNVQCSLGPANMDDDDGGSAYTAPVYYLEDKASDVAETVEASNWESHTNNRLGLALASLDERSQHIVRSRWLDDNKATLQDLADTYSISAERVRQLEKNAMKKLKQAVGDF